MYKTTLLSLCFLLCSVATFAQSDGDALFEQGQTLQAERTIDSQQRAIKKFKAARIVFENPTKKTACDDQIAVCQKTIDDLEAAAEARRQARLRAEREAAARRPRRLTDRVRAVFGGKGGGRSGRLDNH